MWMKLVEKKWFPVELIPMVCEIDFKKNKIKNNYRVEDNWFMEI
jgi:hypothetical protein